MKEKFSYLNENGEIINYDILCTFTNDENGKDYMIYTNYEKDEKGNILLLAAKYNPNDLTKLEQIENEEERKSIEVVLDKIKESIKNN